MHHVENENIYGSVLIQNIRFKCGVKIFLLVSAERRMSEGDLEQGAGASPDVVQYPAVKQLFVVILSWLLINL